ncbi:MAG: hypothetical protein U5R06_05185 [candidate division KSB1 bacterium]|nr:hypothetical protein [candidate division KSB1 bacterium]
MRESAEIYVNDEYAGTLWCLPFELSVGKYIQKGINTLEIRVTNLSANRIRDLDRRGVNWKRFYDINFVDQNYEEFDASDWPVAPSGLLGPVRLIPVAQ